MNTQKVKRSLLLVVSMYMPVWLNAQNSSPEYQLVRRIDADTSAAAMLGIDTKWRRLYGAGNAVIDIDSDSIVGHLPASVGHAFAFALDLDKGITRRGAIFDLRTLAVLDSGTGKSARDVAYDALTHRAFIVGDTTTVLDVRLAKRLRRLIFGSSGGAVVSDKPGSVIIRLESDSIIRLNARTLAVDAQWGLGPCVGGRGLAVDRANRRIFVSCANNQLGILDVDNGRLIASIPIPGAAFQLAFDSAAALIFNPTGAGTVAVVKEVTPDQFKVLPGIESADSRSAAVVDDRTHRVFLYEHRRPDALRILVFDRTSSHGE